jgi:hypothetical protein
VWEIVKTEEVPKDRKPIGCKWVFKKKRCGLHRARLVAQGYSQIPGVDFTENFAPVVDDVTFRIFLNFIQNENIKAYELDVKTAFLHGELEETTYMKFPDGYYEYRNDLENKVEVKKGDLRIGTTSKIMVEKIILEIIKFDFIGNNVDPCFFKQNSKGKCIITL